MTPEVFLSALLIFGLRLADVSLSTVRLLYVVRGQKLPAFLLSFVSSIVWLVAVAQVINDINTPLKVIAYALGFAVGTALGSTISGWVSRGHSLVRIISPVSEPQTAETLRDAGFYVTVINAEGRDGEVRVSFSIVPRRKLRTVLNVVAEVNPRAYVTIEEVSPRQVKTLSVGTH